MPIAADEDNIWISDYTKVATFERVAGRWSTAPLPFERAELAGMRIAPLGGRAVVMALRCHGVCGREDGEVPADIVVFGIDDAGQLEQHTVTGAAADPVPGSSLTARFSPVGGVARFGINVGDAVIVLEVTEGGKVTSSTVPGEFAVLCPIGGDKFVGVEHVAPGAPGAVSFQLPAGTTPEQARATSAMSPPGPLRVVVVSAENRRPVELSTPASAILADQLWLGLVCLEDGIALVGHAGAAELVDGAWQPAAAALTREPMAAAAGQVDRLPDGTLVAGTGQGTLLRAPSGEWASDPDPSTRRVAMGNTVVAYTQPTATSPEDPPGPPQRKES